MKISFVLSALSRTVLSKLRYRLIFVFLASLVFISGSAAERNRLAASKETERSPEIKAVIDQLSQEGRLTAVELRAASNSRRLRLNGQRKKASYSRLIANYQEVLGRLALEYPPRLFSINIKAVLQRFSGRLKVEEPETLAHPLMLISLRAYQAENLVLEKLSAKLGRRVVYGLRIRSQVPDFYKKLPSSKLHQFYVPDVNARVLGFTHGQLIAELSKNVSPARKFDYNGLRSWAEHRRYSRFDQTNRAIELTNFAHGAASRYVISDHPDFSLEFSNFRSEEIVSTFFLWNEKNSRPGQDLPDFIYQIVLEP